MLAGSLKFQKSEGFIIATSDEPPDHSLSIPSCAFCLYLLNVCIDRRWPRYEAIFSSHLGGWHSANPGLPTTWNCLSDQSFFLQIDLLAGTGEVSTLGRSSRLEGPICSRRMGGFVLHSFFAFQWNLRQRIFHHIYISRFVLSQGLHSIKS
jgi:hypothetical protein